MLVLFHSAGKVFEQLHADTLLNTCLVSRAIGQEATRALYHNIILKHINKSFEREQIQFLLRSLISTPELALHIRSLSIHYCYCLNLIDKDNQVGAGDLLAHLINLHSLTLVQNGPEKIMGWSCPLWMLQCPASTELALKLFKRISALQICPNSTPSIQISFIWLLPSCQVLQLKTCLGLIPSGPQVGHHLS